MIVGDAEGWILNRDIVELRIRAEPLPEDAGRTNRVDEIGRDLVDVHGGQAQLSRKIADVPDVEHDAARQLALDAEIELLRVAGAAVGFEKIDVGRGIL